MNDKGFTLIEVIAVIAIMGLLAIIITPNVIKVLDQGQQKSYDIMINNIVIASKNFYEECKYGDIKEDDGSKMICEKEVNITLGELVNLGFLTGTNKEVCNDNECITKKVIINPKNNLDISNCNVTIKVDNNNGKVIYEVIGNDDNKNCPNNKLGSIN